MTRWIATSDSLYQSMKDALLQGRLLVTCKDSPERMLGEKHSSHYLEGQGLGSTLVVEVVIEAKAISENEQVEYFVLLAYS